MAASSTAITHVRLNEISPNRRITMGVVEILTAVLIFFVFFSKTATDALTTFVMTPGGITVGTMPNWVVPSHTALLITMILSLAIGIYQTIKGFGKATNGMVGVVFLLLIFSFLTWQASGKSLNPGGMLASAVSMAVPITLGAFSGIMSERAGVVNIAIEGMMLMGSMVGALVGSVTQSAWLGLIAGIAAAVLLAALHAVLSIKYKIDQIISGTVINIFSTGMTSFLSQKFLQVHQNLNNPAMFQIGRASCRERV